MDHQTGASHRHLSSDNFEVPCNVFHIEDTLTGNGLLFLKLASLPHARPIKSPRDIKVAGSGRRVVFAGPGYPWTVLTNSGRRAGRIATIQDYQRCLRSYKATRDGMFLTNTWGNCSRDSRISAEFLHQEVDVVQVDDGWQRYWPHRTIWNLWSLTTYVDPVRLRMEFLNQTRHADKYAGDPLAPANYPRDTLFAGIMFSRPLGWFENSNLPESYFETIPPLVAAWKKERKAIFSGLLFIVVGDDQ